MRDDKKFYDYFFDKKGGIWRKFTPFSFFRIFIRNPHLERQYIKFRELWLPGSRLYWFELKRRRYWRRWARRKKVTNLPPPLQVNKAFFRNFNFLYYPCPKWLVPYKELDEDNSRIKRSWFRSFGVNVWWLFFKRAKWRRRFYRFSYFYFYLYFTKFFFGFSIFFSFFYHPLLYIFFMTCFFSYLFFNKFENWFRFLIGWFTFLPLNDRLYNSSFNFRFHPFTKYQRVCVYKYNYIKQNFVQNDSSNITSKKAFFTRLLLRLNFRLNFQVYLKLINNLFSFYGLYSFLFFIFIWVFFLVFFYF